MRGVYSVSEGPVFTNDQPTDIQLQVSSRAIDCRCQTHELYQVVDAFVPRSVKTRLSEMHVSSSVQS
jgi:hypothetical protein